jgi:hypothetical protein
MMMMMMMMMMTMMVFDDDCSLQLTNAHVFVVVCYRCPGVRRALEHASADEEGGIADLEHRLLTANEFVVEEDHGVMCAQAAVVAEAALHELAHTAAGDISAECHAALLAPDKQYTCYNVIAQL